MGRRAVCGGGRGGLGEGRPQNGRMQQRPVPPEPDEAAPPSPPDDAPVVRRTAFGTARLLPDLDRDGGWLLTMDGTPQSYVALDDPVYLEFEYVQRLAHVAGLAAPEGEPLTALHLGGGALTLPRYLAATRPGSRQRVVELDGPLVELVRERLPWTAPGPAPEVTVADARAFVEQEPDTAAQADLLVADCFGGDRVPAALTSVEFLRAARRRLRPGGLYAANLADGAPLAFLRGQAATAAAVFAETAVLGEPAVLRGRRYGNLVLLASDAPLPIAELARRLAADPFPARVVTGDRLAVLRAGAPVVTDATAQPSPPPPTGAFEV